MRNKKLGIVVCEVTGLCKKTATTKSNVRATELIGQSEIQLDIDTDEENENLPSVCYRLE